ncbi:hypothetical protein LSCM4_01455 [Leishmania orientalis]|uniref:Uncharacterized protein n=1 Tax=Leishmania orientalis TaxID=2249476 RepID=A0A836K7R4_9TRYP|nr:hypothetical protein LSCM4_01455 [Leishmania orientalis]
MAPVGDVYLTAGVTCATMILPFHIMKGAGRKHSFSTVCRPSTTVTGAIYQLLSELSIPTERDVKTYVADDVPSYHLSPPLTTSCCLIIQRWSIAMKKKKTLWRP